MHVQRALRPSGRARRVGEEIRVLRVDLERRQLSGPELDLPLAAVALPLDDVLAPTARRAPPRPRSRASERACRAGTSGSRRRATFASESWSRCRIAGAAKPEKIGTCTAPMCAHACEATAAAGDIGMKIATRSPGSTPSATSASASRVTSVESSANVHSRRSPFSPRSTAASASGVRRAQSWTHARATLSRAADEPFRPFGAVRRVEHALPRLRELDAEVVDDRGPEPLRLVDRAAVQLVVIRTAEPAHQARHVRVLDELGD